MEPTHNIQVEYFKLIKERLGGAFSLVDEIADLLDVSNDSAYRRIRGETALTFDELGILSQRFNVSVDAMLNLESNAVVFTARWMDRANFSLKDYLAGVFEDLEKAKVVEDHEIMYYAKDLPLFYNWMVPEMAAFKSYFWRKSVLQLPDYEKAKFHLNDLDEESAQIGAKILESYLSMPSTELWNDEVISSTLRQIEFYHESGFFSDDSIASLLLDKQQEVLDHIQLQAEHGFKFKMGMPPAGKEGNFQLYYNEVVIGDHTVVLRMHDQYVCHISHNVINDLFTVNNNFAKESWDVLNNLVSRSTLISTSSEKARSKFFNRLRKKIDQTRSRLEL